LRVEGKTETANGQIEKDGEISSQEGGGIEKIRKRGGLKNIGRTKKLVQRLRTGGGTLSQGNNVEGRGAKVRGV